MNQNKIILQVLFWILAVFVWFLWASERVAIFQYFEDQYKDIGYLIITNQNQWNWYVLVSIFKLFLILLILYKWIPKYGFQIKTVFLSLASLFFLLALEWISSYAYYNYLLSTNSDGILIDWNYNILMILGVFLFWGAVTWILGAAFRWIQEYQNFKKLYKDQKAYVKLKEQLNPHFLFNALNNVYELAVHEGNERLSEGMINLTNTLRYTLDFSGKTEVLLADEIKAIQSFIGLQKARYEENELVLNIRIGAVNPTLKITPLILLNYIENAFIHGYQYEKKSQIDITIHEDNGKLKLTVLNTNHALRENREGGNHKVEKILALNYPDRYQLRQTIKDNFYILELWIQLN